MTFCRVCGFDYEEPIWGLDQKTPNFEICPCCGVEFGHEDYTRTSVLTYRQNWLSKGAPFFNRKYMPEKWDIEIQFAFIPDDFA